MLGKLRGKQCLNPDECENPGRKKRLKLDSCLFISRDSATPNKFRVQQVVFEPSSFKHYAHVELGIIAKRFGVTQIDLKNQHLAVFLRKIQVGGEQVYSRNSSVGPDAVLRGQSQLVSG